MSYGFRPRMFVVTTLFESQNYIIYVEIKFCINVMLL